MLRSRTDGNEASSRTKNVLKSLPLRFQLITAHYLLSPILLLSFFHFACPLVSYEVCVVWRKHKQAKGQIVQSVLPHSFRVSLVFFFYFRRSPSSTFISDDCNRSSAHSSDLHLHILIFHWSSVRLKVRRRHHTSRHPCNTLH